MLQVDSKHKDGEYNQIVLSAGDLSLTGALGEQGTPLLMNMAGQQLVQGVELTGNLVLMKATPEKHSLAAVIGMFVKYTCTAYGQIWK